MNYEVIYSKRKTLCLQVKRDGTVVVRAPIGTPRVKIEEFTIKHKDWIAKKVDIAKNRVAPIDTLDENEINRLKALAYEVIPNRVKYYAELVGVSYASISINRAKTRFGSCSSQKRLNFSCNLMRYPSEVIDYVVLHEVAHLKELNHSKKFWAIVQKYMPDYKERKRILKER